MNHLDKTGDGDDACMRNMSPALSLRSHLSEQVAAMNHYTAKENTSLPSASRDIANAYAISSYSAVASAMQSRPQETKTIMVKACQTEANAQLRGQTSYCMRRTDALGSRCCQRGSGAAGNATKFLTWRSKQQSRPSVEVAE